VHAPDFHGRGRRSPSGRTAPITLADEVALIAPVLTSGRPVHLVGHSIGGAVALKAATLYPNAVVRVVVYEPVLYRWQLDDDAESDACRAVLDVARRIRACLERGSAYRAAAIFLEYWSGRGAWEAAPPAARDVLAGRCGLCWDTSTRCSPIGYHRSI
jgi:pimeloyl-ACP methyl ester carboxylesterase